MGIGYELDAREPLLVYDSCFVAASASIRRVTVTGRNFCIEAESLPAVLAVVWCLITASAG